MPISPGRTLLAIKALSLAVDITPSDRLVGCALIEHYNRRTGRCDPSTDRLATLLDVDRRTVIRSTQQLANAGLFRKTRHGGHMGRNSYEPVWEAFDARNAAWSAKFKNGSRSWVAPESPQKRQGGHFPGDPDVPQTDSNNLQNRTLQPSKSGRVGGGCGAPSSAEVAYAAAERRWGGALRQSCGSAAAYTRAIAIIDKDLAEQATRAEMKKSGAGIKHLLLALEDPLAGADGCPANESTVPFSDPGAAGISRPGDTPGRLTKTRPDEP